MIKYSSLIFAVVFVMGKLLHVFAVEYMVNPDKVKKQDYDGIGIGMVKRPPYCERTSRKGDRLRVHFNGSLPDGSVFESSFGKKPFEFTLGEAQVIPGWEYGLLDMCIGEMRHLTVPAKFAYGDSAIGARIPARITLYFMVELLDIESKHGGAKKSNMFTMIDTTEDGLLSRDEVVRYLQNEGVKDQPGEGGLSVMLKQIFQEEDRDKDGFIDHKEFSGVKHDEF